MGTGWYATDYVKKPRIPSEVTKDNPALSGDANGSVNGNQSEKRSEPKETKKPRKSGMANMEKSDVNFQISIVYILIAYVLAEQVLYLF